VPRVSLVVPIYEVEAYIDECLTSLRTQTWHDFEVVMVDDGSRDGSAAIAAGVAETDRRFTLVRQENAGLGAARNTGVEHAGGEFLMFVDSDDKLPADALARLVATLDRTGSDFATGNILRFNRARTRQAIFVARTFMRSRRRTHVSRFRWLLSDRMAQNKLWRRSFWDAHGLRFPVGCVHEDIPVVLPAHMLARSVDVLRAPVYLYRQREDGTQSITQRRAELGVLLDRLAAVEGVRDWMGEHGGPGARRAYEESVVEDDLRYHIDVLDVADDRYREVFVQRANAFLDAAGPGVEDRLPAIQRLKWHLVRRRLLPELLEVVAFQKAHPGRPPARWIGGRRYGAFPYLDDPRLAIPRSVYRLDTARRRARHALTLLGPPAVAGF
jgi:CDP-glycerol glycerophosphotransferase